MDSIFKYLKEERDVLFMRGQEKERVRIIKYLLAETDFTLDKIAKIADVTLDFAKSVQQQLAGK